MNLLSLIGPWLDNICQIRQKWYYSSGWNFLQSKRGLGLRSGVVSSGIKRLCVGTYVCTSILKTNSFVAKTKDHLLWSRPSQNRRSDLKPNSLTRSRISPSSRMQPPSAHGKRSRKFMSKHNRAMWSACSTSTQLSLPIFNKQTNTTYIIICVSPTSILLPKSS
jgi:hypothetical protein